jgi:16S rRNA (guanine527-N7)-methyltransferase
VTSTEFKTRLGERAKRANVELSSGWFEPLEAYFSILCRWNARMNLTALPLESPTDETFDRLLIEPLAAAPRVSNDGGMWFDLGSGGGSPAIPLKIARPSLRLVMIESKARKAAFLREATRTLGLKDSTVENARFEEVAARTVPSNTAELATVRAVRGDAALFETCARLLRDAGSLLVFRSAGDPASAEGFQLNDAVQLTESPDAVLATYTRVFHVEQRR